MHSPAQNTQNKIEHKKRPQDDQADKIYPWIPFTQGIIDLRTRNISKI